MFLKLITKLNSPAWIISINVTVTIGIQLWMAEGLKTIKYNDVTPIPNVTDNTEWVNLKSGAYC